MLGTLSELAHRFGGKTEGDASVNLTSVAPLAQAGPSDLAPLTHPRYVAELGLCRAGALLTDEHLAGKVRDRPVWAHPAPRRALAHLLAILPPPPFAEEAGDAAVDSTAQVHLEAKVAEGVTIGAMAIVERGATVGAGSVLGPRVIVGKLAEIGKRCELGPGAMVLAGCVVGDRVKLGPGAIVGADGFGFVPGPGGPLRVPQRGIAVLEDDVELGALTVVDRATLGETVVRKGAKVDNLVQIGHNAEIGARTIVAAQSGVAGSARVGADALLGGQTGVGDHLTVGEGARLAARSGVTADVPPGATMAGYPALPHPEWLRAWGWLRRASARRGKG